MENPKALGDHVLAIRPIRVKAPKGARVFEIHWADGVVAKISHELLRGYCPCATCQGHGTAIHFVEGGDLELREIESVGNYALQITWGDGHATGIYSFRFLRSLSDLAASLAASAEAAAASTKPAKASKAKGPSYPKLPRL